MSLFHMNLQIENLGPREVKQNLYTSAALKIPEFEPSQTGLSFTPFLSKGAADNTFDNLAISSFSHSYEALLNDKFQSPEVEVSTLFIQSKSDSSSITNFNEKVVQKEIAEGLLVNGKGDDITPYSRVIAGSPQRWLPPEFINHVFATKYLSPKSSLSVYLESGCGDKLSSPVKQYIQNLLKANMEGPYGSEWPIAEKVKRREMVAPGARYIFVLEDPNANQATTSVETQRASTYCINGRAPIVGFVQYRFTVEEEIPVLYVYELQLGPHVQRKGLGKFLMQLIELIAHKNQMGAVVLTVQKENLLAMNFYMSKLR
ncbi:uncharacterized protein LOC114315925 [Camellia sinensis]|uniref:uncharacterized protein LOC114315925 n=1 Tax=Camellia sinensis TaxID=4442 RepID=UPI00103563B2|nr:uncharacterized protein LOC114315925 [Camellia sinensis]